MLERLLRLLGLRREAYVAEMVEIATVQAFHKGYHEGHHEGWHGGAQWGLATGEVNARAKCINDIEELCERKRRELSEDEMLGVIEQAVRIH